MPGLVGPLKNPDEARVCFGDRTLQLRFPARRLPGFDDPRDIRIRNEPIARHDLEVDGLHAPVKR